MGNLKQPDRGGEGLAPPREGIDYLGGFGLVHDDTTDPRIVMWDSAA